MKNFKRALLALFLTLPFFGYSQSKIAHVDYQKIVEQLPEYKKAMTTIDSIQKDYGDKLKALQARYQKAVQEYQEATQKVPAPSDVVLKSMVAEIQQLEERVVSFQNDAKQDIQDKQEKLFSPIQKKIKDAVKAVAKDSGYNYIIDISATLYADDTTDVTALVKKKLGIK
jgi:outer membrane protein